MSARPPLPAGPYLVVGLARSGAAIARVLRDHGEVIGVDTGDAAAIEGVEVHPRADGVELLERVRTVVKSPGVPRQAAVVRAALERGIEVTGELELAWRLLPERFVAVTGTNGKTTTSELLGAIARQAELPVAVAGNVGTPLAALVGEVEPGGTIVCECSSFQLEDSSAFAPEAALLLNVEEDHLDRHGTFDAYRDAKLRIFANQRAEQFAITPRGIDLDVPGQARRISFGDEEADLADRDGGLYWHGEHLIDAAQIRLRGAHNRENAMGAAAAARALGWDPQAVRNALMSFAGVQHRLEEVAERDGVLFVNDSKATNVASARVGIDAFEGGVHAILGGSLKGGGFEGLREVVKRRCRACYLIGEAAERLEHDLAGTVPLHVSGDLDTAVARASAAATAGDVVLLSPACASYDQYRDYEERGAHFRALVQG